ncbi:hypothetical protein GDO78_013682 [Eleutherodactylus coqui]|uniref:BTB domain-containing protein n=1 Tax=Eleutherodactylus coqui TaxID=57060 RepID=A0A8J6EFH7_ELECQ|nr:hypothetical protein GDO78_013682 [Eleutherodactylus coqui]
MMQTGYTILNELRLEGELCDVVIKAGGVEFKAHKNILCGCSPYFRALFTSVLNDSDEVYDFPGVSPDIMKLILEYAYTWTVPINPDNVKSLFIAADYFNILGLVQLCSEFLMNQLCPENCIGIYKFIKHYYYPEPQHKAYTYILQNFENIRKTSEEFLELLAEDLKALLEKDELNIKQEEAVFEAIIQWIDHNPTSRKQDISHLLPVVRFALMDNDYFNNKVKTNSYIRDNEECKPILIKACKAFYNLNMGGLTSPNNPMSRPRLPSAILLAIGGWSGGGPTNAIESYNVRADTWKNIICDQECLRAYHGAAYLNGYVYIIGGFNSVDYFNSVKRFDPVEKTWQEVAPMHAKRCYVSVTVLDDNIYAIGGFDGHFRLNTAERYEMETNQWSLISPMNEQRSDASATTLNDKVGGFDGVHRLRSAESYNPINNTWHPVSAMFTARSNFGIEVLDDHLYVVGGFNGFTTIYSAECYNEKTDQWCDVQGINIYRSGLSCCVIPGLPNIQDYVASQDIQSEDNVEDSSSTSS